MGARFGQRLHDRRRPDRMKLKSEPLVQFLIAGALLYGGHAWLGSGAADNGGPRPVRLTRSEVEWLRDSWQRQWRRPPSDEELRRMAIDLMEEELLSREARELGLDESDTVVRRRLAQKMTFMIEDATGAAEPTEEELRRLHEAKGDRLGSPARVSFRHVYLSRDRRGDRTEADAGEVLSALSRNGAAEGPVGDPFLHGVDFVLEDESSLAGLFGPEFAKAVLALEPGSWQGPVPSAYGLHLVRVGERQASDKQPFAQIRDRLIEAWFEERRAEARRKYFETLLEKYPVDADPGLEMLLPGPRSSPEKTQP